MDDKRQESQKTVVAFVAGLLIGGLLVWVFTAGPSDDVTPDEDTNDTVEDAVDFVEGDDDAEDDTNTDTPEDDSDSDAPANEDTTGEQPSNGFSFSVPDQGAGTTVLLGENVQYPTTEGWVVVHESANGELGNALGAARYNTAVGLAPNAVELLRGTVAGNTYTVVYYTENGDRVFDLREDVPMTAEGGGRIETTFTAE